MVAEQPTACSTILNSSNSLNLNTKTNLMKTSVLFLAFFLFSISSFSSTVPGYVPTNGLVGWWPFSGNANDQSGNGNNGTASGAVLGNDRFGTPNAAYAFDGVDDYIMGSAASFPVNDRTVAFWFNTNTLGTTPAGRQILGYGGGQCNQSWLMRMTSAMVNPICGGSYELNLHCGTMVTCAPFGTALPNGAWKHLVISSSQSGIDFYVNGVFLGGSTTGVVGTGVLNTNFYFGTCPNVAGNGVFNDAMHTPWGGLLDDIGIWNRALTQQEVTTLYNGVGSGFDYTFSDAALSAYPNPAIDQLSVEVEEALLGTSYSILDYTGRSISNGEITGTRMVLDVGTFAKGVYLLRLDGDVPRRLRFIKG